MSAAESSLPAHPSLEQLRKQAKDRLAALRASDPSVKLADAQFDVARQYGFESWPKLVGHVSTLIRERPRPGSRPGESIAGNDSQRARHWLLA